MTEHLQDGERAKPTTEQAWKTDIIEIKRRPKMKKLYLSNEKSFQLADFFI